MAICSGNNGENNVALWTQYTFRFADSIFDDRHPLDSKLLYRVFGGQARSLTQRTLPIEDQSKLQLLPREEHYLCLFHNLG